MCRYRSGATGNGTSTKKILNGLDAHVDSRALAPYGLDLAPDGSASYTGSSLDMALRRQSNGAGPYSMMAIRSPS